MVELGSAVLFIGSDERSLTEGLKRAESQGDAFAQRMEKILDLDIPTDGIEQAGDAFTAASKRAEQASLSIKQLSGSIGGQTASLNTLKKELETVIAAEGKSSAAAQAKQAQIDKTSASIARAKEQLAGYKAALNVAQQEMAQASGAADDLGDSIGNAGKQAEQSGSLLKNALSFAVGQASLDAAYALGEAIIGVASGGVQLNSTLEDTQAKLNAFTKDGNLSAQILEQIREEASATPFAFQELADATANLIPSAKAAGAELFDLVEMAEVLAASNPAEGLTGAAFALKEAVSGDFTSAIERFNLSRTYINKLKEEGVPALEIVRRAMQQMGYDTDLVANLAETASGKWSTFKDELANVQAIIGESTFEELKDALSDALGIFSENGDAINEWANDIGDSFGTIVESGVKIAKDVDWKFIAEQTALIAREAAAWSQAVADAAAKLGGYVAPVIDVVEQHQNLVEAGNAAIKVLQIEERALTTQANAQRELAQSLKEEVTAWDAKIKALHEAGDVEGRRAAEQEKGATMSRVNAALTRAETLELEANTKAHTIGLIELAKKEQKLWGIQNVLQGNEKAFDAYSLAILANNDALQGMIPGLDATGEKLSIAELQFQRLTGGLMEPVRQFWDNAFGNQMAEETAKKRLKELEDLLAESERFADQMGKLNEKRAKEVASFNQKVADLNAQRTKSEGDTADSIEEKNEDLTRKLGELAESHQARMKEFDAEERRLKTETAKEIGKINEAATRKQDELTASHNKKLAALAQEEVKINADKTAAIVEAEKERNADLKDADEDLAKAREQNAAERLEAEREYARESKQIEAGRVRAVEEANAQLREKLSDIGRQRRDETASHAARMLEIEQDLGEKRKEIAADVAANERDYQRSLEDGAKALEKRLDDLQGRFAKQSKSIQGDIDEILDKARDVAPARFEYDESTQTFRQVEASAEELYSFLSAEDRKRVDELRARLAEEKAEYDAAVEEAKQRAAEEKQREEERYKERQQRLEQSLAEAEAAAVEAERKEEERHKKALQSLRAVLMEAVGARKEAIDEANAQASEAEAEAQAKQDETLTSLKANLKEAEAAHKTATDAAKLAYQEQLDAATASHQAALDDLRAKQDEEKASYDAHFAEIGRKRDEDVNGVKAKNQEALDSLNERMDKERASYDKAETEAKDRNQREIDELKARGQERLNEIDARLQKEEAAHQATMQTISTEMAKLEADTIAAMDEIVKAAEAPKSAVAQLEGKLNDVDTAITNVRNNASNEIAIRIKAIIDKVVDPNSPTPMEVGLRGITDALNELNSNNTVKIQADIDKNLQRHSPSIVEQTLMAIQEMTRNPYTLTFRADTSALSDAAEAVQDTIYTSRSGQSWRNQPDTEGTGTRGGGMWRSNPQAQQQAQQQAEQTAEAVQEYTQAVTTGASDTKKATQQLQSAIQSTVASVTSLGNASSRAASQAGMPEGYGTEWWPTGYDPDRRRTPMELWAENQEKAWNEQLARRRARGMTGGAAPLFRLPPWIEQEMMQRAFELQQQAGGGTPPPPTTGGVGPATAPSAPAPGKQITINQTIYAPDQETVHRGNRQSLLMAELL
jgi:hypothetical protein